MNAATGTTSFHISRPRIDGPAERTVIEPWLTELPHLNLNAYADGAFAATAAPVTTVVAAAPAAPALAVVETLPAARPMAGRRPALAEAA